MGAIDLIQTTISYVFLGAMALAGVVCVGDWLVRTRRLSPFGAISRFFRTTVDPALAPIEQRVVRSGGNPTAAPWWALVGIVVIGVVLLSLLNGLRNSIARLLSALSGGIKPTLLLVVIWAIGILQLALIVRVIATWIPSVSHWRIVRWSHALTEWMLRPLRSWIRPVGMVDLTPLIAYFALWLIQGVIG
jgi:YggT family protein